MKIILFIFIIFISPLFANSIDINKSSSKEILSSSQIFIDDTKTMTIKEISTNQINFSDINSVIKRFGYWLFLHKGTKCAMVLKYNLI